LHIGDVLDNLTDENKLKKIQANVLALCQQFKVYE
jgi:glycine/serine hydroxymethyltransferase